MSAAAGNDAARAAVLAFLKTIQRPDRPLDGIGDDDHLVESGLIDSLAILEIVTFLECEFGVSFRDSGVEPERLSSIGRILELVAESRR